MTIALTNVKKDNVVKISLGFSLLALFAFTALVIFIQGGLPPYIPLLNTMPWGEERLLNKIIIFSLPAIAGIVTIVSALLVASLYDKNVLMARIVSFNTLLFNVLALLALLQIILLVL